jgi:hypothetical protein
MVHPRWDLALTLLLPERALQDLIRELATRLPSLTSIEVMSIVYIESYITYSDTDPPGVKAQEYLDRPWPPPDALPRDTQISVTRAFQIWDYPRLSAEQIVEGLGKHGFHRENIDFPDDIVILDAKPVAGAKQTFGLELKVAPGSGTWMSTSIARLCVNG